MTKYQIAFMVLFGWGVWDNHTAEEFGLFLYAHEGVDLEYDFDDNTGRLIAINPNEELLEAFVQLDQQAFEETIRSIPAEAYEDEDEGECDIWL